MFRGDGSRVKEVYYYDENNPFEDDPAKIEDKALSDFENQLDKGGTYERKYDKQGNWIQEIAYFEGIAKWITEAEITYYESVQFEAFFLEMR